MNQELYTIKDTVTGVMNSPVTSINRGAILRDYGDIINSKEALPVHLEKIRSNVKDLQLYKIGDYNVLTGEITPCNEFICNLIDLKTTVGE